MVIPIALAPQPVPGEIRVSSIDKHDRILELTEVPPPSEDVPAPLVLSDEHTLIVAYMAATSSTRAAVVVFRECYATHFGPPNDEAFATHPADPGVRPYGAFEVQRSAWLRGFEMRNRSHPRHDPAYFQQLRHWVWTFHDSVLECAARSYEVMGVDGPRDALLARMHDLLHSS
jgi:hypothetical protein